MKKRDSTVDKKLPAVPDPFWPAGVEPTHLSVEKQRDKGVAAVFSEVNGGAWHCKKCGTMLRQSKRDSSYCSECYDSESQNTALAQKINANWMEQSKELGLEIFERQPEETMHEWFIWCKYREFYPLKMPTWTELASVCDASVATVTKAANKWSFKVRLIAWARHTDADIQEKRIAAIKQMNDKQLGMAQTIQDKLKVAIDNLQPELLKPGEIVNLFKVATELERRVTTYVDEKIESTLLETKNKQVTTTRPEDLSEVVAILQKTGLLEGKVIGVEQTTRLIAKEDLP